MSDRSILVGLLKCGAALTALLILSAIVWLLLALAGDRSGAFGTQGICLVAAVGCLLNFFLLCVMLAISQVRVLGRLEALEKARASYPAE